jgi:YidC/Oxa1 family membrane protein insertase
MNRNDKIIVALLFALLMGWLWHSSRVAQEEARQRRLEEAAAANNVATNATSPVVSEKIPAAVTNAAPDDVAAAPLSHIVPEQTVTLHSADMDLLVSSRGATLQAATLPAYRTTVNKSSGPVILDFHPQPALALSGIPNVAPDADYTIASDTNGRAVTLTYRTPRGLSIARHIELRDHYQVVVADHFSNASDETLSLGFTNWVTLGTMYRGDTKNDEIAADSFAITPDASVRHWSKELPKLFGGGSFGCSSGNSSKMPPHAEQCTAEPQQWVALKSRFFVEYFASSATNVCFKLQAERDLSQQAFTVAQVSGAVAFPGGSLAPRASLDRTHTLYIGPKKLKYLENIAPPTHYIMEFGWFSWFARLLLRLLNIFYSFVPNYGVAIIALTVLVRLIFWPLTHKSTQSMQRMREIQPLIKAAQENFKDDPQKMQHEVWRIYRENKVNPLSSCLPMLLQIPVFFALYIMLRSAVELRFAPFLWIADLSQPENLFAGVLPIPINILPLLMAATTIWQSKLTPSMGDPMQQKMMTWMMPLMMLFLFYSMPAGLSLYWTVSTLLAILQLIWQQRSGAGATPVTPSPATAEADDMTRQMKRRLGR